MLGTLVGCGDTDGLDVGALLGLADGAIDELIEGRRLGAAEGRRVGTSSDVVNCDSITGALVAVVVTEIMVALMGTLSACRTTSLCRVKPGGS